MKFKRFYIPYKPTPASNEFCQEKVSTLNFAKFWNTLHSYLKILSNFYVDDKEWIQCSNKVLATKASQLVLFSIDFTKHFHTTGALFKWRDTALFVILLIYDCCLQKSCFGIKKIQLLIKVYLLPGKNQWSSNK